MNTKSKKIVFAALAATLLAAGPAPAQDHPELELAGYVPPGALVYAEAADLGGDLAAFLESEFAARLPKTRAFKDFTTTKLYNKLADRIGDLESATGFGLTLESARQIAGSRAALALYDIGELRMLFLTRIPADKLAAAELWKMRDSFDQRRAGDQAYYVKEDPDGRVSLAFAVSGSLLLAGTDLIRFEEALALIGGGEGGGLAADERFSAALPEAFQPGCIALYLDMEKIVLTSYFRVYWVWGNQADLADLLSAAISVGLRDGAIVESRWIRQKSSLPAALQGAGKLAAALPAGADAYEYRALAEGADPGEALAGELYESADESLAADLSAALESAGPVEMAVAVSSEFGQAEVFLSVAKTVALRLRDPGALDRSRLESALASFQARRLLPEGQAEFEFADSGGARALRMPLFEDSAPAYAIRDDVLVITNKSSELTQAAGGSEALRDGILAEAPGASRLAALDAAAARETLTKHFKIVAQRNNWDSSANAAFFWRNASSLLGSLDFVDRVEIVERPEGGMRKTELRYVLEEKQGGSRK